MAKVDIYNLEGAVTGQIELSDAIFGIEPNEAVLHQVIKGQLANLRQGTAKTKTRSEVRGGGRRPYRQKGTGRARQGSIRAAQWVGGGVIFGPAPRDYTQKLPKKLRRLALKSALSTKVKAEDLVVVENFDLKEIKTKTFAEALNNLKIADSTALLVSSEANRNFELSARNIKGVKTTRVESLNALNIIKFEKFVVTKAALEKIQEVYA